MRTAFLVLLLAAVAACGQRDAKAPTSASTTPAIEAVAQPVLRPLAAAPTEARVCLDDPDTALDARLRIDGVWSHDPVVGQMAHRGLALPPPRPPTASPDATPDAAPTTPVPPPHAPAARIQTHSPATLRAGLARYLVPQGDNPGVKTASLITYAGERESCAWLVAADGIRAYGRTSIGAAGVRADVAGVLKALDVQGAMNARAPRLRSETTAPASSALPTLDQTELATALANVAETVTPSAVAAALKDFDSVIIVPHEALLGFPFTLLTAGRAAGPPAFLIERMSIQIAPSLSEIGIGQGLHRSIDNQLATMTPAARDAVLSRALIVGNPAFNDRDFDMPSLPGAAIEAQGVAEMLGATAFTGEGADLGTVRTLLAARPRYVHFATHGISDGDQPALTDNKGFLALANGDRFTVGEARSIRMADGAIVVLSACQSGLGASRPGGIVGLPRAFQLAGAQTVVMSLWNVDDAATADLMRGFVRHLGETGRPASSFAAAVRETRTRYPDPRLWSAFEVFGVARP